MDGKQIGCLIDYKKEGPAQNEIFSIQEGGPPLTDDMILGRKLYKKQSRLLGLYCMVVEKQN